jgi:DNA-binding transcriptional MocR family regulator
VRSAAKFLGPDVRVALVAADAVTAERLHARLGPATTWVSHLLQHAVATMLADPAIEALRLRARATYADRAALLGGTDGLNVWIETDVKAEALAARGWRVRPAAAFAVGEPLRAIRVTTSTLTPDQAAAFAADLKELEACSPA